MSMKPRLVHYSDDTKPNPGSLAAIMNAAQPCYCPKIANNNGDLPAWPGDGWWIMDGCPLHNPDSIVAPTARPLDIAVG